MPAIRKNAKVPKIPGWKIATATKNAMVRNTARICAKSVILRSNRTLSSHSYRYKGAATAAKAIACAVLSSTGAILSMLRAVQLTQSGRIPSHAFPASISVIARPSSMPGLPTDSPALRRATNGSLHQSHRSRNQAFRDDCQFGAMSGSRLIKSTIQELRRAIQSEIVTRQSVIARGDAPEVLQPVEWPRP
jgi:hypothetical protein